MRRDGIACYGLQRVKEIAEKRRKRGSLFERTFFNLFFVFIFPASRRRTQRVSTSKGT